MVTGRINVFYNPHFAGEKNLRPRAVKSLVKVVHPIRAGGAGCCNDQPDHTGVSSPQLHFLVVALDVWERHWKRG